MAFTATQVAKVLLHLKYPALTWAKTTITEALGRVTDFSSELETEVGDLIIKLDTLYDAIETDVTTKQGTQVATTGAVYYAGVGRIELERLYKESQNRLAQITGLQVFGSDNNQIKIG